MRADNLHADQQTSQPRNLGVLHSTEWCYNQRALPCTCYPGPHALGPRFAAACLHCLSQMLLVWCCRVCFYTQCRFKLVVASLCGMRCLLYRTLHTNTHLLHAHLTLDVFQVLLLLDWGQVRHIQAFAYALARKLCSIAFLHHHPH